MSETLDLDLPGGTAGRDVDALNARARALCASDLGGALDLAQEALRLAEETGYPGGQAAALRSIGECENRLARHERARASLERAVALFHRERDRRGEADALNALGAVDFTLSAFPAALERFTLSLRLARSAGDRLLESNALNGAATVRFALADYHAAVELYLESIEIKRELGDRRTESGSLNNLGLVYHELGDHAAAADLHERALAIKRELHDLQGEANALSNLGVDHHFLGNHGRAVALHEEALAIARRIGNRQTEAGCLENLGLAFEGLGRQDQALELHEASLALQRELGNRLGQVGSLVRVGTVRARLGGPETSLASLREAIALAEEIGARKRLIEAQDALAAVLEQVGDVAGALAVAKAAATGERTLHEEQLERSTAALLAGFRVERAVQEAEIERLRNVELACANASLRQADEEKSRLLEQLAAQALELKRLAREDPLTGLWNRRHVEEVLAGLYAEAEQADAPLCVALVDVDHFKRVNDGYSHRVGDEALRVVAGLLQEATRETDIVARYGGEEFVAVFRDTTIALARQACERMRQAVEEHDWAELGEGLRVTVSAGVAERRPGRGWERLVADADRWLYEAKRDGRNAVRP